MMTVRTIGLAVGAAIAAFLLWSAWDRVRLVRVVAARARCETAASTIDAPLGDCGQGVRERIEEARRAADCETSLRISDAYATRASCGEQVKRVVAERDSAQASFASAKDALAAASADRDAAVARAEARIIDFNHKVTSHERTIAAAPRLDDGRVHCDAGCLRDLAGDAPARR